MVTVSEDINLSRQQCAVIEDRPELKQEAFVYGLGWEIIFTI